MPTIVILGSGAMACLFGAKLAPLVKIALVGHWAAQIKAIRQDGLTLIHPDATTEQRPLPIHQPPLPALNADIALILVKSYQTERAAQEAAHLLKADGLAVTLQNGLGNDDTLTAVLGSERVAQATTTEGANLIKPGVVHHAGWGQTHLPNTHPALIQLADLLIQAGFDTHLTANIDGLIWGKLAVNAGINPLTAWHDVPNGFLAENENARQHMMAAAREVQAVAAAQGITLPYADAGERALQVAQATQANSSSMRQDIRNGRYTEIEAICGAVIRIGRQVNVPTPLNEHLYQQIKRLEIGE